MPETAINGYTMYYEVHGEGLPLVMVHGGLGGGEGCAAFVEHHAAALAGKFQLVVYDRRAAGRSSTPEEGYSIPGFSDDLFQLLGMLGVERAHILGSSAGGPIALQFALDHPGMTDTLILINTMSYAQESERVVRQRELDRLHEDAAAGGQRVSAENALESRWHGMRQQEPGRFDRLLKIHLERFEGVAKTIQAYLDIRDSLESRLDEIAMPTLVAHGDSDSRIAVECGRQLHERIGGSELHIIPGAEHGLMSNEPALMRELVLGFLERRASPAIVAGD